MKKTKIVIPALAVLLLSTAASVSGTVAWFSMNTSINVTGMTVTTKVSSSLQIAEHNDDAEFSTDDLDQTRDCYLQPASSVDGNAFFYTTNANALGDANSNQYSTYSEAPNPAAPATPTNVLHATQQGNTGKTNFDKDFNETYGYDYDGSDPAEDVAFAYIDYAFYLKANVVGDSQKIVMDDCNILYAGHPLGTEWAWRVALFAHSVNANVEEDNATTTASSSNLITILDLEKSKNFNEVESEVLGSGVSTSGYKKDAQLTQDPDAATADGLTRYYKASDENGTPKAISGAAVAPTEVSKPNLAANITSSATGSVRYKVVVRLWLEGEDVSCNSDTFASLTSDWTLSLSFKLGSTDGVQNISTVTA